MATPRGTQTLAAMGYNRVDAARAQSEWRNSIALIRVRTARNAPRLLLRTIARRWRTCAQRLGGGSRCAVARRCGEIWPTNISDRLPLLPRCRRRLHIGLRRMRTQRRTVPRMPGHLILSLLPPLLSALPRRGGCKAKIGGAKTISIAGVGASLSNAAGLGS